MKTRGRMEGLYRVALEAVEAGQLDDAIRMLRVVVEREPALADARRSLIAALQESGELREADGAGREALAAYREAWALAAAAGGADPGLAGSMATLANERAQELLSEGQVEAAGELLREAIEAAGPTGAERAVVEAVAAAARADGRHDAALGMLDALVSRPGSPDWARSMFATVLASSAEALEQEGRTADAVERHRRGADVAGGPAALERRARAAFARVLLVEAERRAADGDVAAATELFHEAAGIADDEPAVSRAAARAVAAGAQHDDPDGAVALARQVAARRPEWSTLRGIVAQALRAAATSAASQQRFDDAATALTESLDWDADHAMAEPVLLDIVEHGMQAGERDAVMRLLDAVVERHHGFERAARELGALLVAELRAADEYDDRVLALSLLRRANELARLAPGAIANDPVRRKLLVALRRETWDYIRDGHLGSAASLVAEALDAGAEDSTWSLFERVSDLAVEHDDQAALSTLRRALAAHPELAERRLDALERRVDDAEESGDVPAAVRAAGEAHVIVAEVLSGAGADQRRARLVALLRRDADAALAADDDDRARSSLRKLYDLEPGDEVRKRLLGVLARRSHHATQAAALSVAVASAIEALEVGGERDPLLRRLHRLGAMALKQGDDDVALDALRHAADGVPGARQRLAAVLGRGATGAERAGDLDKAVNLYREAVDAADDDPRREVLHVRLARAISRRAATRVEGEIDAAISDIEEALLLAPRDDVCQRTLAVISSAAVRSGQHEAVIHVLLRVLDQTPDESWLSARLAGLLHHRGALLVRDRHPDRALAAFRQARELRGRAGLELDERLRKRSVVTLVAQSQAALHDDPRRALELACEALGLAPLDDRVHAALARASLPALHGEGQELLLGALRTALDAAPGEARASTLLAAVLHAGGSRLRREGRLDAAVANYREAVDALASAGLPSSPELADDLVSAFVERAGSIVGDGEVGDAEALLEQADALRPGAPSVAAMRDVIAALPDTSAGAVGDAPATLVLVEDGVDRARLGVYVRAAGGCAAYGLADLAALPMASAVTQAANDVEALTRLVRQLVHSAIPQGARVGAGIDLLELLDPEIEDMCSRVGHGVAALQALLAEGTFERVVFVLGDGRLVSTLGTEAAKVLGPASVLGTWCSSLTARYDSTARPLAELGPLPSAVARKPFVDEPESSNGAVLPDLGALAGADVLFIDASAPEQNTQRVRAAAVGHSDATVLLGSSGSVEPGTGGLEAIVAGRAMHDLTQARSRRRRVRRQLAAAPGRLARDARTQNAQIGGAPVWDLLAPLIECFVLGRLPALHGLADALERLARDAPPRRVILAADGLSARVVRGVLEPTAISVVDGVTVSE